MPALLGVKQQSADLGALFAPRSVAVVGASREPGTVGHAILRNVKAGGFAGPIYPVNPKAVEIEGLACSPDILKVPGEVDLAVVIVRAPFVPAVLEQCADRGVTAVVVISAGFKEIGGEGVALEEKVREIIRERGLTLVGPNCLGVLSTDSRLNATFAEEMPPAGKIAFISQSGALCTAVLAYAKQQGIGFSRVVSMGNRAGVDEIDLLRYLHQDPKTEVILLYVEALSHGRRFIETAREITGEGRDRKPILAIKSGRTPEGAKAASSHTGSLAGSDELYDAIFAQAGVLRVESMEELFDYARAFQDQPLPKGNRVAIVTNAGGPGIMATDACVRYGLDLASFRQETVEAMKPHLPPTAALGNPVDLIGDARHDRYEAALTAVAADPGVDGILALVTPQAMTDSKDIAEVVAQVARSSDKPVLASFMGITGVSSEVGRLGQENVPHYQFPEAAVRALAAMCRYTQWIERPRTEEKRFQADKAVVQAVLAKAKKEGRRALSQSESLDLLTVYGFPMPAYGTARSADEAVRLTGRLTPPVAMKILSTDIFHKVDVGGVRLNLRTPEEVGAAFREVTEAVSRTSPQAKLEGVLLQRMAPAGTEVILGMKRDPQFGPVLMFGLGGIFVEVFRDVTFRLAPIRELGARRMVESIRGSRILKGFRGQPPADIPVLLECLERLSQLALELEEIQELDINPLIVHPQGQGVSVVDARFLL